MRSKVTVVGAGNVGAMVGQRVAERDYADVVLGYDSLVVGTNGYDETENSDIVVITSGIARKPGMSRDDLVRTNQGIVTQVTQEIVSRSPNTIIICVTNPL